MFEAGLPGVPVEVGNCNFRVKFYKVGTTQNNFPNFLNHVLGPVKIRERFWSYLREYCSYRAEISCVSWPGEALGRSKTKPVTSHEPCPEVGPRLPLCPDLALEGDLNWILCPWNALSLSCKCPHGLILS